MTEYERVREEFKQNFSYDLMHKFGIRSGSLCEEIALCALAQVLPFVEIRADDQSLPNNPYYYRHNAEDKIGIAKDIAYTLSQQNMLKADKEGRHFIKVAPKEE